jgi:hypothetical protein
MALTLRPVPWLACLVVFVVALVFRLGLLWFPAVPVLMGHRAAEAAW